jgi:hypothetical protein
MYETTGILAPVIEAYLHGRWLDKTAISVMRAYLRQWIMAPVWDGVGVDELRASVSLIRTRSDIQSWLDAALDEGIDPL